MEDWWYLPIPLTPDFHMNVSAIIFQKISPTFYHAFKMDQSLIPTVF